MRVLCDARTCANNLAWHCINSDTSGVNAIKIDAEGRCMCYVPEPAEEDKGKEESDE